MIVGSQSSSVVNICINISLTTSWILAKLGRNDLYIALFDNCSNDFGQHRLKIDFQDEKFKNVLV